MNRCWKLLQASGVDVYTVKTDSFTILSSRIEEAEELLNWEAGIGSWRFSRSDDIKFPDANNLLELKENSWKPLKEYPVRPIQLSDEYDIVAMETPGHTIGCVTWILRHKTEGNKPLKVSASVNSS